MLYYTVYVKKHDNMYYSIPWVEYINILVDVYDKENDKKGALKIYCSVLRQSEIIVSIILAVKR